MFSQHFTAHDPRLLNLRSGLTPALTGVQLSELAAHRYALLQAAAEQSSVRPRPPRTRGFAARRALGAQRVTS